MTADRQDINPYASPSSAAVPVSQPLGREEALRRMRIPATGLAISAAGSLIVGVGTLVLGGGPPRDDLRQQPLLWIPVVGLLVVLPILVLTSAVMLVRERTRPWLWISIVSGLVPVGSGCVCFSMVFAFWLLHLAMQRPIRDALRAESTSA